MPRMENVDIAALEKLIRDINIFSENMKDLISHMLNNVSAMQEYWDDPQYKEFYEYMQESIRSLYSDVLIMDDTHQSLTKVYDILTK